MSISPAASAASVGAALGGLVAAGEQRDAQAGGLGERRDALEMLAGEDFGRRHQRRLPPGLDHVGHGEQRDDRLAGADVALQQPQHALLGAARSARISSIACVCAPVSANGSAASMRCASAPWR